MLENIPKRIMNRIIVSPYYLGQSKLDNNGFSENDFFITKSLFQWGYKNSDIRGIIRAAYEKGYEYGRQLKNKTIKEFDNHLIKYCNSKVNYSLIDTLKKDKTNTDLKTIKETLYRVGIFDDFFFTKEFKNSIKVSINDINKMLSEQILSINGYNYFVTGNKLNRDNVYKIILEYLPYLKINDDIFIYKKGIFIYGNNIINTALENIAQGLPLWITEEERKELSNFHTLVQLDTKELNEMKHYLQRKRTISDDIEITPEPSLFCCKNGMINAFSKKILEFDPKYKRTIKYNVVYEPESKDKYVYKFINEIFSSPVKKIFCQIMGATLSYDTTSKHTKKPLKYIIYILGEAHSGKSLLQKVIYEIITDIGFTSIALTDIENSDFVLAKLHNKLINFASDISNLNIKDCSYIKKLTGDDVFIANRKHKDHIEFSNKATQIFSCNNLPKSHLADDAYYERLLILKTNKPKTQIDLDTSLIAKLITEKAKSTWMNLFMQGYKEFVENGYKFDIPQECIDLLEKHKLKNK